jgi:hypothetical protein
MLRNLLIAADETFAPVDDEDQNVGAFDRPLPLFDHQCVQRILAGAEKSPSIKELKG